MTPEASFALKCLGGGCASAATVGTTCYLAAPNAKEIKDSSAVDEKPEDSEKKSKKSRLSPEKRKKVVEKMKRETDTNSDIDRDILSISMYTTNISSGWETYGHDTKNAVKNLPSKLENLLKDEEVKEKLKEEGDEDYKYIEDFLSLLKKIKLDNERDAK